MFMNALNQNAQAASLSRGKAAGGARAGTRWHEQKRGGWLDTPRQRQTPSGGLTRERAQGTVEAIMKQNGLRHVTVALVLVVLVLQGSTPVCLP